MTNKKFFIPLIVIPSVVLVGTIGFSYLDGMGIVDALYLTVITITTVGYGDVVPLSAASKIFASILSIFGIGAFLTMIPFLIFSLIERSIKTVGKMKLRIKNHIIVCGYNPIARKVITNLIEKKEKVVVISPNSEDVNKLEEDNILGVLGDPTEEHTLEKAKIGKAKALIAVAIDDADNLLVTLTARGLNKDLRIIAKVAQEKNISKLRKSGANDVYSPETLVGSMIADSAVKELQNT